MTLRRGPAQKLTQSSWEQRGGTSQPEGSSENAAKSKCHLGGAPKAEQGFRCSCVTLGNLTDFSELRRLCEMVVSRASQGLGEGGRHTVSVPRVESWSSRDENDGGDESTAGGRRKQGRSPGTLSHGSLSQSHPRRASWQLWARTGALVGFYLGLQNVVPCVPCGRHSWNLREEGDSLGVPAPVNMVT